MGRDHSRRGVRPTQIDLSGRTALVTGSTAGIGEATTKALASAGADVVVIGRNADRVAETAKRIGGRGITADVGTAEGTAELIRKPPEADIRLIRPHEVAAMITYVASEQASATTRRALGVDGGLVPTIFP
ncbi:SDR family NAD(P)-dependent oxidoreductase [Streptomyces misionensis]|uniref:SDR family NAD(P)-dependent oxidoreductase n=1 Tax=Streptomyces misionensis TaxID=67331 RepID=A0A5C6K6G9_9ACTN|nr:SDR family NAD(P)-dependent oxidoreductase [Streptomyces misionensis]TWV58024.1 SDR family NAD(P)-dependent oxidoreductase [Streptomyces misionensis]